MGRARTWLYVWLGWTALALFFAISNSLTYRSSGQPANWALSIQRSLTDWWMWAAATPLIVWLTRRFPLQRPRLARAVAVHVAAACLVAIGKLLASRALFALLTGVWMYVLLSTFALNLTIYAGIVCAALGVEYYRRSRERDQLEARLAETRLQLLGMQLQPHFLFNTLNTIAELVHEDPDAADAMIAHLSDLLRRTLELGSTQQIPLGDELDLVARYVDIQKVRFGDRLRVDVSAEPAARAALVPALLLQPVVENAIRHGVSARRDAGHIVIDARAGRDAVTIAVSDDGNGASDGAPERVGLGNTRARLEAMYGGRASLALTSANGRGTRVTIEIPRQEPAAAS